MQDIRFYIDFGSAKAKRKANRTKAPIASGAGNCLAISVSSYDYYVRTQGKAMFEGVATVYDRIYDDAPSPLASTAVSVEYLREACKRVSEAEARRIHPELFQWLDTSEDCEQ